jgi:TonB family protein
VTLSAICLPPAAADDNSDCEDRNVDAARRVTACSALIASDMLDNTSKSQALNNRGQAYYRNKDLDHALTDFADAIKMNPANADAFNNRGNLYWSKLEDDRAFQDLNETIRIDRRPEYFLNRGEKYSALGDLDRAISDFDQAVSLDPQLITAYLRRANAYSRKKDFPRAMREYDQLLQLEPANYGISTRRRQVSDANADHVKDMDGYIRVLMARAQLMKQFPRQALREHAEGVVHVSFTINRRGSVTGSRIVTSSGFPILDQEALALVQRAQPFPPLPGGGPTKVFSLPVRFRALDPPGASR